MIGVAHCNYGTVVLSERLDRLIGKVSAATMLIFGMSFHTQQNLEKLGKGINQLDTSETRTTHVKMQHIPS